MLHETSIYYATCIFCGIHYLNPKDGLLIRGKYICPDCEMRLSLTNSGEPEYDHYMSGLKNIWCCMEV